MMIIVIIMFVCAELVSSGNPVRHGDPLDQHADFCSAADLLHVASILKKNSGEVGEDGLPATDRYHRNNLVFSLTGLLELIAASLFSFTGVLLLLFKSDRIRRFLTVHHIHLSDGQKPVFIL
jgi:hypothetical protein